VLLEEQELPSPQEYLNSLQTCSGVRVTQSLVLCAVFCRLLYFLPLWSLYCHCMVIVLSLYCHCMVIVWSLYCHCMVIVWSLYGHCIVCPFSIYGIFCSQVQLDGIHSKYRFKKRDHHACLRDIQYSRIQF